MHILYFHQHFSTPAGATGTRSYEMARRLIEKGYRVTMVCGSGFLAKSGLGSEPQNGIREGWVDGIHVIEICLPYSNYDSLLKRASIFLQFALTSIGIAWKQDYDLLFATSTPLTAGIPGIVMRFLKPRKKFVFEVRDLWPELPKAMGLIPNPLLLWILKGLEQLTYAAMNAGVALSPGIKHGIQKGCGAGKPVAMIPNGCDLELFKPREFFDDNVANSHTAISHKKILRCVFTGAHGKSNGLDAVLNAAIELSRKKRKDIQLLFIGDGMLKPHLRQRAFDENLDNCIFLDPIPKTKLAEFLREVDVGMMILENVQAFYYGTSPNKFFDYISCGLPVLNNYPGWVAELINQNQCGIAVPPEDPIMFADALIRFADNPEMCKCMGQNSRKLAESKFSRDLLADQLVNFLDKIHNSKK